MFKVKTFNKIAPEGLKELGDNFVVDPDCNDYDAVILRSYKLHDEKFPETCKVIARAGAGYNNVPVDRCTEEGIVVMNTPGANANAVKELVICAFLLGARNIMRGATWVQSLSEDDDVAKLVEKEKSRFKGNELDGKKVGVIGLGAIGVRVANALDRFGCEVYGYDPYISVEHAWNIRRSINRSYDIARIFEMCDFVTIHVPLSDATRDLIDEEILKNCKPGIRVINLARGGIVNDDAIVKYVENGRVAKYVTDFPNEKLIHKENIICIPHLGASTPESESNCAIMAAKQVRNYLENGNIVNSVNFPNCDLGVMESEARICMIHKNIPNVIGSFSSILARNEINIANMSNKSRGPLAYSLVDTDTDVPESVIAELEKINGVTSIRVIKNND